MALRISTQLLSIANQLSKFEKVAAKPSYKDYAEEKKRKGLKPMPKSEWEARVLGKHKTLSDDDRKATVESLNKIVSGIGDSKVTLLPGGKLRFEHPKALVDDARKLNKSFTAMRKGKLDNSDNYFSDAAKKRISDSTKSTRDVSKSQLDSYALMKPEDLKEEVSGTVRFYAANKVWEMFDAVKSVQKEYDRKSKSTGLSEKAQKRHEEVGEWLEEAKKIVEKQWKTYGHPGVMKTFEW